jgi:molybdate transport system substrate-binding protein
MRRLALIACIALAPALSLAGCGSGGKPQLLVSAAASLERAFTTYGQQFKAASARFSFAGSDLLAAQIEQGLHPDVFASANMKLPDLLYSKGLVQKPVAFAANRLVLAVPAGMQKVSSLADLEHAGVTIAIGSPTVPIGVYTRTVLARLGPQTSARILANVRSDEPDVSGIVGKLIEGAVDAGFVYITDVDAAGGKLRAIQLPDSLEPTVSYGVAVVRGDPHPAQAQAFITGLLSGAGRADLLTAGFLPPGR